MENIYVYGPKYLYKCKIFYGYDIYINETKIGDVLKNYIWNGNAYIEYYDIFIKYNNKIISINTKAEKSIKKHIKNLI